MTRTTTYDQSYPNHNPEPRVNYYDFPSLQWRNFRTIRKKPAPHRVVEFDRPPGLGMGSMVSDNWYRFHLGHLTKPTIFKEGSESIPAPKKEELIDMDDIRDIVKTKTLVSTNKSFYKSLPMVKTVPPNMEGVKRPLDQVFVHDRPGDLPQLSRVPRCTRERRLPGYAGYIPQTPVVRRSTPTFSYDATTVNTVHRPFPAAAHDPSHFVKSGSLSRHVTLTYPFNPFNKISN
ncbi:uncharacterized protein LOC134824108 [Bolinopsis microptera]|uniref:uncharacterized protein LOC134824108 n=1 Tax=Bolinopsis microptera TaxID=2820187 RepID=UPI003078B3FB